MIGILSLVLIVVAPALLVIFSAIRIANRLAIPIGAITFLAMILSCLLTFLSISIISNEMSALANGQPQCGMPEAAYFMAGGFITLIVVPIIGCICGMIYHLKNKKKLDQPI